MIRAHVKVNISVHLEDEEPGGADPVVNDARRQGLKYPLSLQRAGDCALVSAADAHVLLYAIGDAVSAHFEKKAIASSEGKPFVPKPSLAFGGVYRCQVCGTELMVRPHTQEPDGTKARYCPKCPTDFVDHLLEK